VRRYAPLYPSSQDWGCIPGVRRCVPLQLFPAGYGSLFEKHRYISLRVLPEGHRYAPGTRRYAVWHYLPDVVSAVMAGSLLPLLLKHRTFCHKDCLGFLYQVRKQ
jgi:hypothetical protein